MLFPGNRNQQHAAACIFFELKWAHSIVPNLGYLESEYEISRRVLQRARAKLSGVGVIEHVSYSKQPVWWAVWLEVVIEI